MDLADTHAHLTDEQFAGDLEAVLDRARQAGLKRILTLGTDVASSRAALALAERYPDVYAAVGVHPEAVGAARDLDVNELRALAKSPRVVAIGEIGLDYYWDKTTVEAQQVWFERQLELAAELNLPACIHDREAHAEVRATLRAAHARWPHLTGVLHAFSGDAEMAVEAQGLGWYIAFGGPLTFRNARVTPEVARAAPWEQVLIETDSPYLSPHPHRGKRNEPARVALVAERLAELRAVSTDEAARRTFENAQTLFRW